MTKFILGSASPRRHELLKEVISDFSIVTSDVEEIINPELNIYEIAMDISKQKALDVAKRFQDSVVIGADTIVYCNGEILLKPKDYDDAFRILKLLSKNKQSVITGVTIAYKNKVYSFYDETIIEFENIDDQWIDNYIITNKPFDKSGSYGIQEIDSQYIKRLDGDITNVIGLPVVKLKNELDVFLKTNM